ncbi:MAG: transcriptional regulator [Methanobacteriales archaeon HGW-Methanobacteriales-1]|nr:MAG: transcriptional regulator [Methanobacteriales archaeon HGW-Methanobacteriales-1]
MKIFKNKGELTRFQILSEIARNEPHLRQKDIANKLGITIQAVSENMKNLVEEGYVESGGGRFRYKITKKGIERIKKEALALRKYSEEVLDTMNSYKTIWPAIAEENLKSGAEVGLFMKDGTLYASNNTAPAHAEVLTDSMAGEDVALIGLGGTIELKTGNVVILVLPTINQGGSKETNLDKIIEIYEKGFDRVGIMGTVSRAVVDKLEINADFEFATPQSTVAAAKRGLDILVFAVGKMKNSITRRLDEEGIPYTLEDVIKA